jgi:hypothetical protein
MALIEAILLGRIGGGLVEDSEEGGVVEGTSLVLPEIAETSSAARPSCFDL